MPNIVQSHVLIFEFFSRCQRSPPTRKTNVHEVPNAGTGEGIPHEPLPDQAAENRNGARVVLDRTPNKNLVSKQAHEAEEGNPGDQGAQRTGETGAGSEGGRGGGSSSSGRPGAPAGPELVVGAASGV